VVIVRALVDRLCESLLLLDNPVRISVFILDTRVCRRLFNQSTAHSLHGHRHHVAVEIGDDPDRAGDDEKDDQHAEGERQNIVGAVGAAAQMQKEDEVDP